MPKIMKISALRNYSEVLDEVRHGEPVYFTKNGEGRLPKLEYSAGAILPFLVRRKGC